MKQENNTFYEYQRLKRWLILLIFVPVNSIFITGCIIQIGLGKPWGNNPMQNGGLIVITILILLLTAYMLRITLKTFVDKDGIHIGMWLFPFYTKTKSFSWEDISEIAIKKYSVRELGGWGIRMGSINLGLNLGKMKFSPASNIKSGFNSIAYTMYGNIGIRFVFQNKKNVLIGTNKPEELSEVLRKLGKSESNKE